MSTHKAYVSMPRHNGERYAKLMVEQFEQMSANDGLERSNDGVSRWYTLFGTPERAARTLLVFCECCYQDDCSGCYVYGLTLGGEVSDVSLLEWLRGDAE